MVDFNNESTIGTPAIDIVRILILQARANLFLAIEDHHKSIVQEGQGQLPTIRARLFTYFLELQAGIKRRWKDSELYNQIYEEIRSSQEIPIDRVVEIICILNEELDKLNLIKIDNKKRYDSTIAETENIEKKL